MSDRYERACVHAAQSRTSESGVTDGGRVVCFTFPARLKKLFNINDSVPVLGWQGLCVCAAV